MKIEYIFALFAVIGGLDHIFGNKLKLGEEFEKGIMTTGVLVLSMTGTMVLAPVLAEGISFLLTPVFNFLHIDISAIGSFFAVDSGGAVMSYQLSDDVLLRGYHGMVIASMFGATICPVIPLSLQMIDKKHNSDVFIGYLCGFATMPVGCIIAGLIIGIPFLQLLLNTLPIILLSVLICIGLLKAPELTKKIFGIFGALLTVLMIGGLVIGILHKLIGIELIKGIAPIDESFVIIGNIAILLAGVFPLLAIVSKVFKPLFKKLANLLKINDTSVLGLITTLANSVPVFSMLNDMDRKGRILNIAFVVSAGFLLGDHLAFALAYDNTFVLPMVLGKFISGLTALVFTNLIYGKIIKE